MSSAMPLVSSISTWISVVYRSKISLANVALVVSRVEVESSTSSRSSMSWSSIAAMPLVK